jgi:hypothetical protein
VSEQQTNNPLHNRQRFENRAIVRLFIFNAIRIIFTHTNSFLIGIIRSGSETSIFCLCCNDEPGVIFWRVSLRKKFFAYLEVIGVHRIFAIDPPKTCALMSSINKAAAHFPNVFLRRGGRPAAGMRPYSLTLIDCTY